MTRPTRHRLQIAVLVIVGLLFQQAALATYLCPVEQMPAETVVMAEHCAEMGIAQKQDTPALYRKHCSPDQSVVADAVKLSTPPLALSPVTLVPVLVQPVSHTALQAEVPIARSDPPPRLRFWSLLI